MIKPLLISAAAALTLIAGPVTAQPQDLSRPGSTFVPKGKSGNWENVIARTARGHMVGDPQAKTKLIEFISYTCPHCADFTAQGEPALDLTLLTTGKISLEVRPVIRNGVDLAVSLLAQCGNPADFKVRHRALMLAQNDWLDKARATPVSQQTLWQRGDKAGRMNVVSALGLTALLVNRGSSQAQLDACVADDAAARKLVENGAADAAEFKVPGTPSFVLDGKLLENVHSWEALYPVLAAKFTPAAG